MTTRISSVFRFFCLTLLCLGLLFSASHAQQQESTPQQEPDDVVRVTTELVQTDVTVVDKQGRPVKDLKQEQFQLFVDGKQQPISFFERVTTGSASEEAQLAAARGSGIALEKATGVVPSDRGRAIFFFVDDLHMAPPNLIRARRAILEYLDRELGQNDQAAITSTSGQLGFLQQMTDNKLVLKRAAEKLKSSVKGGDMDFPPMTEIEAFMMLERGGSALMSYFIEQLVKDGIPRISAENLIRTRAKALLQQAYHSTKGTLSTLETLARRSGQLPGRKLIFFISDGFVMNLSDAGMIGRLHNITDAAARNNVVIYALDSRGLMTGKMDDPTAAPMFDPGGRLASVENQDMSISQEPLQVLASSTGGRAFLNSNSLKEGFSKGVKETSAYYLLAWRPLNEEQRNKKFRRIEVKIIGRPDLTVHLQRGFYDLPTKPPAKDEKAEEKEKVAAAKTPDVVLNETIGAPYPRRDFPTQLSLVYVDMPDKGAVLTASMQLAREFINFDQTADSRAALVDLAGVVLDERGKQVARFRDRLTISLISPSDESLRRDLTYNFQTPLKPGLYQVRVAARDSKSTRSGSAMQWIEIPDLAERHLSMSSLLLSETKEAEAPKAEAASVIKSAWSVDHHFARTSGLRFLTYIYNAARGADGSLSPDVALQVQILRNDQPVLTTTLRKVEPAGQADLSRLAYAAELPLEAMPPGRYILQVTVIDRVAKASTSQRASFEID